MSEAIPLCNSADLRDGDLAVPFDVIFAGQTCRAFAIRFKGKVHAYLNRCGHVAMEMDYQPNRFLMPVVSSLFAPRTGLCIAQIRVPVRAAPATGA